MREFKSWRLDLLLLSLLSFTTEFIKHKFALFLYNKLHFFQVKVNSTTIPTEDAFYSPDPNVDTSV